MTKMLVTIGVVLILLMGCFLAYKAYSYINQGGYIVDNGMVTFKFWNEAHGWQTVLVSDDDIVTFKVLDNPKYALDKKHVYYRGKILEGADPSTFEMISEAYAKDAKHVFASGMIFENVDPNSFVLLGGESSGYSKDRSAAYFLNYPIQVCDLDSFESLGYKDGQYQAKDSQCFYSDGEKVSESDNKES